MPMNRKKPASYSAAASLDLLRHVTSERRIQNLLDIVAAGTSFAIRDLAAEFHLSPCYLQRLFKQETGVRLGEWLGEQRLQRAASLLANSYLSIKEITHTVGYEHTSSFNRAFERRFLQAPAHYRRQVEREHDVEQSPRRANRLTRLGRR
jgi:transcriptional regulator GlxA family with amidase domain